VPAAWIMYIVREKDTKCKYQQVRHWVQAGWNINWVADPGMHGPT